MKPTPSLFAVFAALALAGLAGCKPSASPVAAAPAPARAPRVHPLTGEVISVTPERSAVLVHHDQIPGFMPAMTMEFIVTPADLARLKAGQRLRARMVQDDKDALRLDAIEVLDPVKEAAIQAAANQLRQDTTMRGKEAYREVGETIPSFSLYDQHGNVFSPAQVRGRWVVMNFIYTRCPIATMCPASTQRMMDLQAAARTAGRMDLELLSLSLDPVYDTPTVLKDYADARGIDPANFRFLTGPEAAVRDLLHQFGVIVEPGENYLKHTLSTLLINPEGRIVHRVDGTTWAPEEFLRRLPAPAPPTATTLPSPAAADTGESSLHTGPDGTVYLTWSGPGDHDGERALRLATLAPEAKAWSAARTIVSTPLLMENWADFATLAVGTDGQLWAQWFQRPPGDSGGHGYSGWFARSADGGMTWSAPAPLGHEFVALTPLSGGRMLSVWLESTRDPAAPRGPKDPNAPYRPSMRLASRLLGPDGARMQDWIVDPDVCTCCQNTLARLPGDRVLVAYRGHRPDETRDNGIALFDGTSWNTPQVLHPDGWKIAACPVNGPAADAVGETVALAWFTAADGIARVQAKISQDGGRNLGPALPVDLGRPIGRVDLVALPDGSSVLCWIEAAAGPVEAGIYARRIFTDGKMSDPWLVTPTTVIRASGFPRLATRPGDGLPVVLSWTEAVPADPANPRSAATTRVRTAEFSALPLRRTPATAARVPASRPLAIVSANAIVIPEFCLVPPSGEALH